MESLRPDNSVAARDLAVQCVATAAAAALSTRSQGLPWLLAQLALGVCFWRWFVVLHSCGHRAYFRSPVANDAVGLIASAFCGVPYFSWRHIHQKHHVWTGWRDLDPTMEGARPKPRPPWVESVANFCWRAWVPVFSLIYIVSVFWNPRKSNEAASGRRARWLGLVGMTFAAAALASVIAALGVRGWLGAYLVFLSIGDLSILTQHVHLPMHESGGAPVRPFSAEDQDRFTCTVLLPPRVARWVFGNFNLHGAHHAYPAVPHYYIDNVEHEPANPLPWREWILRAKRMTIPELLYGAEELNPPLRGREGSISTSAEPSPTPASSLLATDRA